MTKFLIVIAYDISDDKRRHRVFKALKKWGIPVQLSVFECILKVKQLKSLKCQLRGLLKAKEDHVRYYVLCAQCHRLTETTVGKVAEEQRTLFA